METPCRSLIDVHFFFARFFAEDVSKRAEGRLRQGLGRQSDSFGHRSRCHQSVFFFMARGHLPDGPGLFAGLFAGHRAGFPKARNRLKPPSGKILSRKQLTIFSGLGFEKL